MVDDAQVAPVEGEGHLVVTPVLTMKVGVRSHFAAEHLWNAQHMAQHAEIRQTGLQTSGFRGVDRALRTYALSALLEAVAFLEAYVNGAWQDVVDSYPASNGWDDRLPQVGDAALKRMCEMWNTGHIERALTVIEKYQVALTCIDQPRLDLGGEPGQTVAILIRLRNELVHFTPATQWTDEQHKLQKALEPRLGRNPLSDSAPWFTNQVLTAECARLACDSVRAFAQIWQGRMGLSWSPVDEADGMADQLPGS